MKLWLFVLQAAILIGCSSKGETAKKPGRYLYFTSNFPSSIYWEITTTFRNKSGNLLCKDLSMGEGGLVQATKNEHYILKQSKDTIKVPLFWSKPDNCGWDMSDVSIRPAGRRIRIHGVYLKEKSYIAIQQRELKFIPVSLNFNCSYDSEDDFLNCKGENTETDADFLIDDLVQINRLQINLKGF